jgi:glyoxylase-like metal-dependent hydrolase (beta-lactamase superfamily II)
MKKLLVTFGITCFCFYIAEAQKDSLALKVSKLCDHFYVHTSYQMLNGAPFPSNGLIVETADGILLIDTGWGDEQTEELVKWVRIHFKKKILLCIGTHFHADRIGGLPALKKQHVPVISYSLTEKLAKEHNVPAPNGILPTDTTFKVGNTMLECFYPGEGHTKDNIVVWFPAQKILFGGCLVKSVDASDLGNLADANVAVYPMTIQTLMKKFPDPIYVIPGHQSWRAGALQHTLDMANSKSKPSGK